MGIKDYLNPNSIQPTTVTTRVQSRLRSRVTWIAMASLLTYVLKNYFDYEIPHFDELWTLVMGVLVAVGVLNNPTNPDEF